MIDTGAWGRRVKLQHLRTVMAVSDTKSLAHAAERLGLTQPAVTKILHEVESELGVQLFTRTSRGTYATSFGSLMVDHIKLVFAQLDQAAKAIHNSREGLSGRVVVGALIAGAASLLPRAIARMQSERPGVRVTIIEGTYDYLTPLLRQGQLDFIVGRLPKHEYREGLAVETLFHESIALVVRPGHPALSLKRPDLAALLSWPWIFPLEGTTLRQLIESAFHESNIDLPDTRCESVSVVLNRRLILETDYIGAFPRDVIHLDVQSGLLNELVIDVPLGFGPVGISHRKVGTHSSAADALLTALRVSAGKH